DGDADVVRDRRPDFGHLRPHALDHGFRVRAPELHDHPAHDFTHAVLGDRALAGVRARRDRGDVGDADGDAVVRRDDGPGDVVRVLEAAEPAEGEALAAALEVGPAERRVVPGERLVHVGDREAPRREAGGVDHHVELLREPAPRVALGDAGHGPEPGPDHVVVQRLELGERHRVARQRVLVQLAHRRGHGAERRLDAGGERVLGFVEPLLDEGPGEVDVEAIREGDRDDREPGLRDLAHVLDARQPNERRLEGVRDEALDLLRCVARRRRDDADDVAAQIRVRIERHVADGEDPDRCDREREEDREPAVPEHEVEEPVQHAQPSWSRRRRISAFAVAAPWTMTVCPASSPATISTAPAVRRPVRTGTASIRSPSPRRFPRITTVSPSRSWTASAGTARTGAPSVPRSSASTYISGRSAPSRFSTRATTSIVRVSVSSAGATRWTVPSKLRSGYAAAVNRTRAPTFAAASASSGSCNVSESVSSRLTV